MTWDQGLFTSHGYSGAPTSVINTGGRPVWESEWSLNGSNWDTAWDDGTADSGYSWAQNVQTGMTGVSPRPRTSCPRAASSRRSSAKL